MRNKKQVKWYKSLLFKVNWSIIAILIIFIVFLSLAINNLVSNELTKQVKENNLEIANSLKKNVNDFLDHTENVISLTSKLEQIKTGNNQEILKVLKQTRTEYSHFEYIYLAKTSGEIFIYPQVKLGSDYNPKQRIWYQKAIKEDKLVWTDAYLDANNRYLMITAAVPVKDKQGNLIGVLAGDILLNDLSNTVANKKLGKTGYAYITNQTGEIIAHPNLNLIKERYNINQVLNYDQILKSGKGSVKYKDNNDDKKLASYVSIERLNGIIFAQVEKEEAFAVKNKLETMILELSLLILALLVVTVYLINKKYLLDPIQELVASIVKVANGNFNAKVDNNNEDEIGQLANNFNYMTQEIEAAYQQLEAYNEEVTELNKNLEYQANHDPLTKLPNRRKFLEELGLELKEDMASAIILLDLNNFKEVNDTLGHVSGDKLLKKFSKSLLEISGEDIFIARYGGDEFLILLRKVDSVVKIEQYINQLQEIVNTPFVINSNEIYLGFSLGIARYPDDAVTTYKLITRADTAMYQAKDLPNRDYLYYNQQMITKIKSKKEIKEKLRIALKNDGFKLKYQPQINLNTGQAEYLEALIRLKNHNISPGKFIPVAEESGLITEIGRWVTKEAIKQLAVCEHKKNCPAKVSINFSVQQLNDSGYIEFLKETLKQNNVNPNLLEIEITESVLIQKEQAAIEFLNQLSELGVKLALDDFGTGYSSLSYLAYISFDKVKIDKFLTDMFLENDNLETMTSLIDLFHSINLPVVAEGVETKEQYQKLKERSCDYIQGYLFSKPVASDKIENLLEENFIENL